MLKRARPHVRIVVTSRAQGSVSGRITTQNEIAPAISHCTGVLAVHRMVDQDRARRFFYLTSK
jgi:hypothetical protein